MNQYVTGNTIKELREKKKLTQSELATLLNVSDKTISKWETGKGLPDIMMLEPICSALSVSLTELLSGNTITNNNVCANMLRSKFYVCPICGNVIHSVGTTQVSCHGISLSPIDAEEVDEHHGIEVSVVEDEYYVTIKHPMTKEHYISFMAGLSPDRIQMVKLYPESEAVARFKIYCVKYLYFYCNKDGLFKIKL